MSEHNTPSNPELNPLKYISRLQRLQWASDSSPRTSIALQPKRRRLERRQTSAVNPSPNDGPFLFVGHLESPPHILHANNLDINPVLSFIGGEPLPPSEINDGYENGELDFSRLPAEMNEEDERDEIIEVTDSSDDSELRTPKQEKRASFVLSKRAMSPSQERKLVVRKADGSEEEQDESVGMSANPIAVGGSKKASEGDRKLRLRRGTEQSVAETVAEVKRTKATKSKAAAVPWPAIQTRALWVGKLIEGDIMGQWSRILVIVNANGPERSQKQLQDKWHAIRKTFPVSATQAAGTNAWSVQGQRAILQGLLTYGGAGRNWDKVVTLVNQKDTSRIRTKKQITDKWQAIKKGLFLGLHLS